MTVARRYALAALAVARQDAASFPKFAEAVAVLAQALKSETVLGALRNPGLSQAQRRQLASTLTKAVQAPKALGNLTLLLAQNGRLAELPAVLDALQAAMAKQAGLTTLVVQTAKPLTDAQKISLKVQVKAYTKAKDVQLQESVKPELIGGFRAFFAGLVWDASVQGGLARLKASLQQAIQ
ncbi:MAG: ATP synthase F1 subunit delta [Alphaproteobacteria bacterium]|nr:ATP synthase F1 subunit delta [Alphaproteobacteria bacterium]